MLDVRASKGAAGMFAARIPITAPKETMQAALYYAHDVAVEGLKLGMSSASVESSGGAAGGIAAVEFYDPRTDTQGELQSDREPKQLPESRSSCCLYLTRIESFNTYQEISLIFANWFIISVLFIKKISAFRNFV